MGLRERFPPLFTGQNTGTTPAFVGTAMIAPARVRACSPPVPGASTRMAQLHLVAESMCVTPSVHIVKTNVRCRSRKKRSERRGTLSPAILLKPSIH